jgi:hypothetical protein
MKARYLPMLVVCVVLFQACPAEMWIPIETTPRIAVSTEHVAFLDEAPTKPFIVLGLITPPEGEYETEAEAVRAIRKEAAKHGADAVFIEDQKEGTGWSFHGTKGGSFRTLTIRAKAIAWK